MLIDSDEVFERYFTRDIIEKYMRSRYTRVTFRMYNFWLSKKKFRIDRDWLFYTLEPQRQMFRNLPGIYYQDIKVHYGHIQGITGSIYVSPYRIKHYGYVFWKACLRWWNASCMLADFSCQKRKASLHAKMHADFIGA